MIHLIKSSIMKRSVSLLAQARKRILYVTFKKKKIFIYTIKNIIKNTSTCSYTVSEESTCICRMELDNNSSPVVCDRTRRVIVVVHVVVATVVTAVVFFVAVVDVAMVEVMDSRDQQRILLSSWWRTTEALSSFVNLCGFVVLALLQHSDTFLTSVHHIGLHSSRSFMFCRYATSKSVPKCSFSNTVLHFSFSYLSFSRSPCFLFFTSCSTSYTKVHSKTEVTL